MEKQFFKSLGTNKLFQSIDTDNFDLSNISGKLITVKEGEILFREGDPANFIYLVVSGEINLLKKKLLGKSKSIIYQNNDFLGYEEYYEETSRTSTAVALRDTYLIALSRIEVNSLSAQDEAIRKNLEASLFFEESPLPYEKEQIKNSNLIEDDVVEEKEAVTPANISEELIPDIEPEPFMNFPDELIDDFDSNTQTNFVDESQSQPVKIDIADLIISDEQEIIEINSIENPELPLPDIQLEADLELATDKLNAIDEYGAFEHEILESPEMPEASLSGDEEFFKKLDAGEFGTRIEIQDKSGLIEEPLHAEDENPFSATGNEIDSLYKLDLHFVFGNQPALAPKLNNVRYQKIIEVVENIYCAETLVELLSIAEKGAVEITNSEAGLFLRCSDNRKEFIATYFDKEIRLPMEAGITGWCCRNNEVVNLEDAQNDLRYDGKADDPLGRNPNCMLCYPVQSRGKTYGVLQMINNPLHTFSDEDEQMLGIIAKNFLNAQNKIKPASAKIKAPKPVIPMIGNYFTNFIKKPTLVSKRYITHLMSKNLQKDTQQILEMMNEQIDRIHDSVQTIINFSSRENPMHTAPVKANELLSEYSKQIEPLLQANNCKLTNEFDKEVTIKVDEKEFYKCYFQIIKNACESMPDGGDILVATRKEKNNLNILIKDNGKGIPAENQALIFEEFFSLEKKDSPGLGLTIAKKIIEELSGRISIESAPGSGSTFIITLPIHIHF